MSAGPTDEVGQALNFIVSNNNNPLFAVQPAVAANGTLTYTPAANANGTATVSVQIHDNGGTANGGGDTSAIQTFTITVTAVNDVPSFTAGGNRSVLEDAGAQSVVGWATALSAGPTDEVGQALNFIVSNNNNPLFSVQPAVAANGTLTYTPAANANGTATVSVQIHDNGGTANGGGDTSAIQTFTITVTAVNDVPSFTAGGNQSVLEDAGAQSVANWATAILAGPPNESSQALDFIVSNNNNPLFSVQPSIAANGTLTYTPAANANGTATITVTLHDGGGTANGGQDTSASQTFTITVNPVNDAPSFTKGADQTVNENAGAQTVLNWATAISAGPPNESGQALNFLVSNDNNALFSTQPAISQTGTLTFTPAQNASGTATVTVQLHDNGGTTNGSADASASQTFTITIPAPAVNHAPSFNVGPDQVVSENSSAHAIANWATDISAGPPDESGQTVTFQLVVGNPGLFSVQPAVDSGGTLSFTVANNGFGFASVTVVLKDNGGMSNGGIDASVPKTFSIAVPNQAAACQNQSAPVDVNHDGIVSPQDALIVINDLVASSGGHVVPTVPPAPPTYYMDVNGNGSVTPNDALVVINDLINHGGSHSLPSASPTATPLVSVNGSGTPAPAATSADAGLASALAATAASSIPAVPAAPPWTSSRLIPLDFNQSTIAKYFEQLASENTANAEVILPEADQITDPQDLDDHLLDALLAGLRLG